MKSVTEDVNTRQLRARGAEDLDCNSLTWARDETEGVMQNRDNADEKGEGCAKATSTGDVVFLDKH